MQSKCFQVEEEPKSPQLLNSTKKVQITNTQEEQTKSVGKESVGSKSDGKGIKKAGVQELSEKDKSLWNRCLRLNCVIILSCICMQACGAGWIRHRYPAFECIFIN
jgi:hypothetical protein